MTGAVIIELRCAFCDATQVRNALDASARLTTEIIFDGDRQTLEYQVDCVNCEFPMRGSLNFERVSFKPATRKDINDK